MGEPRVVHGDDQVLVVVKPPGMPSQPDQSLSPTLLDWLKDHLSDSGGAPRLVHRLDRPVGGLMVIGRSRDAAVHLRGQFRRREVEKEYLAIVKGLPPVSSGRLEHALFKRNRRSVVRQSDDPRAQLARLEYETVEVRWPYSLLRVFPQTGRFHQIRAQLSQVGCPILGDVKYRARHPLSGGGIALMATGLAFRHPGSEERMSFGESPPLKEPWDHFCLQRETSRSARRTLPRDVSMAAGVCLRPDCPI